MGIGGEGVWWGWGSGGGEIGEGLPWGGGGGVRDCGTEESGGGGDVTLQYLCQLSAMLADNCYTQSVM